MLIITDSETEGPEFSSGSIQPRCPSILLSQESAGAKCGVKMTNNGAFAYSRTAWLGLTLKIL
jgi:hypothetical protein